MQHAATHAAQHASLWLQLTATYNLCPSPVLLLFWAVCCVCWDDTLGAKSLAAANTCRSAGSQDSLRSEPWNLLQGYKLAFDHNVDPMREHGVAAEQDQNTTQQDLKREEDTNQLHLVLSPLRHTPVCSGNMCTCTQTKPGAGVPPISAACQYVVENVLGFQMQPYLY